MPRFDQSFNGLCEQNLQETQQLKQRYLDGKNKRVPKTKDKKQQESIQSSVHVQQKFLKRSVEEHDPGGGGAANDGYEPPVKLQCTTQHGSHQPEGLTKFSVEIVQQLEFTTSAANSQPQQISTNVTVKAHTNASVKSDVQSPKPNNQGPQSAKNSTTSNIVDVGTLVECVKQEPDNDFADLDQCAAALEKDAVAHGGTGFGAFTDLIGDDTNDDTLKDLISDITNCPEFMNEFDFEDKTDVVNALKVEDLKDISSSLADAANNIHSPLMQNQNYSPPVFDNKNRLPYSNMDFGKTELSPAAQTLKQMAEQHQHKNQMGLSYNPNGRAPNSRSPYPDFPLPDYGSPNSNSQFHKGNPNYPQADMIKQEMMFQGADFDMKRKGPTAGMYKQQYSPYGSPGASSHGSPGYLPRGNAGATNGPNGNNFGAGTPPRPPSGPGGNNSTTTLQINQAQQLHISQQSHGHNIQVSAGQHLHLSGDLKGNVSVAAQQGMHFTQHVSTASSASQQQNQQPQGQQQQQQQQSQQSQQPPPNNSTQQGNQHNPNASHQQAQQQAQQQNGPSGQHSNSMLSGNQHTNLQNSLGGMNSGAIPSSMSSNMSPGIANSMHSPGLGSMPNTNNIGGSNGMQSGLGGNGGLSAGNNMMGPTGLGNHGVIPGSHLSGQTSLGDSYSLSQSQTINFTQQTLRQRANGANGMTNAMGPGGNQFGPGGPMNANSMAPRHLSPQALEHQKLLQQQMLRAQQVQQHVRPPPPDYKTSAGMMQGMQPRYTSVPPNVRRCLQPIPPSAGPMMMRPHNMYMMQQQQQHMTARGVYPRQQATMNSIDNIPTQGGNTEWRHMLMTQQQTANFNQQIRPSFQQGGFNMNSSNMSMSALQHQQLRVQQGVVGNTLGQGVGQGLSHGQVMNQGNPMSQMNSLNQQIMHMQQQQSVMQQNSNQMSISSIHMQQTQSVSMSSQNLQQSSLNSQLVNSGQTSNQQSNAMNAFNSQTADFSLEFLDNLPSTDTGGFTEQELLSSFDNDSGFNFQDIL